MEHPHQKISHEQKEYRITFSKIAMWGLLIAVIPIFPYVFYQLLKLVVCGAAVFSAYLYSKEQKKNWMWIMIVVAVIFNPINILYFLISMNKLFHNQDFYKKERKRKNLSKIVTYRIY